MPFKRDAMLYNVVIIFFDVIDDRAILSVARSSSATSDLSHSIMIELTITSNQTVIFVVATNF